MICDDCRIKELCPNRQKTEQIRKEISSLQENVPTHIHLSLPEPEKLDVPGTVILKCNDIIRGYYVDRNEDPYWPITASIVHDTCISFGVCGSCPLFNVCGTFDFDMSYEEDMRKLNELKGLLGDSLTFIP